LETLEAIRLLTPLSLSAAVEVAQALEPRLETTTAVLVAVVMLVAQTLV
jgi:hypothetical protein